MRPRCRALGDSSSPRWAVCPWEFHFVLYLLTFNVVCPPRFNKNDRDIISHLWLSMHFPGGRYFLRSRV